MQRQRHEHKIQQLQRTARELQAGEAGCPASEAVRLQEQQQGLEKIRQQLLCAAGLLTSFVNQTVDRSVPCVCEHRPPAPLEWRRCCSFGCVECSLIKHHVLEWVLAALLDSDVTFVFPTPVTTLHCPECPGPLPAPPSAPQLGGTGAVS